MALVLKDRVKETTTVTGTGTATLLGAATGFQSFAAIGNANTTYYTIAGQSGSEWEVGIGTYTAAGTTLSRDTVLSSSNAGSLVTFSAGTKDVFVTYPSSRSVYADGTTLTATNSSVLPIASGGTNSTATPTNGGVTYGTGTAQAYSAAGTSGQVLQSNGAAAPTWLAQSSIAAGSATNATSAAGLSATLAVASGGTGVTSPGTSGNVLTSNGSAWVSSTPASGYAGDSAQVFNASGTFTIPSGITKVKITVVAGGGGGGGGWSSCCILYRGSPGGGGGTATKWLTGLTPGNTLTVTVGAAGAAGATGGSNTAGTGGASNVASGTQTISTISATGGSGGRGGQFSQVSGTGGVGSGGDLNAAGETSIPSNNSAYIVTGSGGSSSLSPGRIDAAGLLGAGGGGSGSTLGYAGGPGVVIFEW